MPIYAATPFISESLRISTYTGILFTGLKTFGFLRYAYTQEGLSLSPAPIRVGPVSPKDHTDAKEMSELTKDDVIKVIRGGGAATGKSTMMPPFGKTITDAEIQDLVNYLRKLCNCKFENEP